MSELLHIVVTCAQRKTLVPDPHLLLRSVTGESLVERCERWVSRLSEKRGPFILARDLYAGDHWAVARELPATAEDAGFEARLWVCSAGYGLISADATIKSYGASFDPTSEDVAGGTTEERRRWWRILSTWDGPSQANEGHRTLQEIARSSPDATILLVLSKSYLDALYPDACEAVSELDASSRFLIVSAGACQLCRLRTNLLPADARLQSNLGGARQSLNVRIARELLRRSQGQEFEVKGASRLMRQWLDRLPQLRKYERTPMTDDAVRTYIRNELDEDPAVSKTALLRKLRQSGRACEQKRFASLYSDVYTLPSHRQESGQFQFDDLKEDAEEVSRA